MNDTRSRVIEAAALSLLGLVFVYSCIRAAVLSIAHDEAITFFIQWGRSFGGILSFTGPMMPNNHFGNTLLVKAFTQLFGPSEFVLRMPALIGQALYLVGIYRIGRLFLSRWLFLLGLASLTLHPFVQDFFSCSRGYGLATGLYVLALSYLLKKLRQEGGAPDNKSTAWAATLSALAVFAQLSFVNIFIPLLAVLLFLQRPRRGGPYRWADFSKRVFWPVAPGVLFLVAVYARPVAYMLGIAKEFRAEAAGSAGGFWGVITRSLVEVSWYKDSWYKAATLPSGLVLAVQIIISLLLAGAASVWIIRSLKRENLDPLDRCLACLLSLLVLSSGCVILPHLLLGTAYAAERWVIFLIPTVTLLFFVLWERSRSIRSGLLRAAAQATFGLVASLMLFHEASCVNLTHFYTWQYDAATKDALRTIVASHEGKDMPDNAVRLGIDWYFEPSINYYLFTKKWSWIQRVDRRGPDGAFDYYYLMPESKHLVERYRLKVLKHYLLSDTVLAAPPDEADIDGYGVADYAVLNERGFVIYQQGDYKRALVYLDRAVELDPRQAVAYHNRGQVYGMMGDTAKAIEDFTKTIELDPRHSLAYRNRGILHAAEGRRDLALADLSRAVEINPRYALAYQDRARLYLEAGDIARASQDEQMARSLGFPPDPGWEAALARLRLKTN